MADFSYRRIEQYAGVIQDDHVVEKLFHILHLMGGNHDTARFIHFADEEFAELAFAGDVQSVGRFVHEYDRGIMNIHTCQKNTGLFSAAKQMHWVGQGKLA